MATIDDIRAKFKGAGFDAHVATKLAEAFALVLANSGALTVKEGGTTVSSAVTALDFGAGFDITESTSGEANVSLDMSEAPYDNSTSGLSATDVQAAIDELAASGGGSGTITIGASFDGQGSALVVGSKCYVRVPVACTITEATALADQSGSVVVDVWKDTYANYPPTDADSITASAPITISSAIKSTDTTLTGWTKTVTAGDVLAFNIDSCSTITRLQVQLKATV